MEREVGHASERLIIHNDCGMDSAVDAAKPLPDIDYCFAHIGRVAGIGGKESDGAVQGGDAGLSDRVRAAAADQGDLGAVLGCQMDRQFQADAACSAQDHIDAIRLNDRRFGCHVDRLERASEATAIPQRYLPAQRVARISERRGNSGRGVDADATDRPARKFACDYTG